MATKLDRTFRLEGDPDAVMAVMRTPEFIEASEKSRDALEVRVEDRVKEETKHSYTIFTKTHARSATGIDRSKTEDNRTEVDWDLSGHTGRWQWFGAHGPRVKVNGTYTLRAVGAGTDLTFTVSIEVGIPLVGRVVEKKVRSGFEDGWVAYVERLKTSLSA